MKKLLAPKLFTLTLLGTLVLTTGLRCTFLTPSQKDLLEPVALTWWGTIDEPANYQEIINDYQTIHPHVKITYRKLRTEEFETELLNALAEDRGPDIFTVSNTDLNQWLPKIEPLPASTKMAFQTTKTTLGVKQETTTEIRETPSITLGQLKDRFIDVVAGDVVRGDKIYGLPLSVDTLVMFYNRDLFNNANLPLPPTNWLQFQEYVKRLTFQDKQGNLIQSGAAIGGGENVDHAFDILSLLMLQNGAQMTSGTQATFFQIPPGGNREYNPGPEALRFYTDFANSAKEVYTWNNTQPKALDAFAQGTVAITFGYQRDLPLLEAKRLGKLRYAVAKIPQIEGRPEVNFASYWIQTVSQKSPHLNESWDFLQFSASKTEAKKYLTQTGRPTALRSLVEEQIADDQLNIFASQLLTSQNWYHGKNSQAAKNAFAEMITNVLTENMNPQQASELASQKVSQTL